MRSQLLYLCLLSFLSFIGIWADALIIGVPKYEVPTSSGLVIGHTASKRRGVIEYLGIPFAEPPVGPFRFAAPRPYQSSARIVASKFSDDCAADVAQSSIADQVKGLTPSAVKLVDSLQQYGASIGEDCLTLNIWSKAGSGEKSKAVLLWIYGGGFSKGTTKAFLYDGQVLADTQDVVVVSINYRTSIFGFPGLPGFDQNVGLLDQRLAVEWVEKNIAAFGGDPKRITLFGNSAGGASIDYYSYAWTADPIVNGFIAQSGVSNSFFKTAPLDNSASWYRVTKALGCGDGTSTASATLSCMRGKSMKEILAAAKDSVFGPTADGKTVFSDYAVRASQGNFIKKPMLVGSSDYEVGFAKVILQPVGKTHTLLQWAFLNLATFTCPVSTAAEYRASNNVPVWRYRYFGEFPNLRLTTNPSSGAWHGSEIAMIFGTAEEAGLPNTGAEEAISKYMMGAWASFAKDPVSGLSRPPYSWPQYNPQTNSLVRLAYDNQTSPSFIPPVTYDYACNLILAPGGPDMEGLRKVKNLTELGGGSEIGY